MRRRALRAAGALFFLPLAYLLAGLGGALIPGPIAQVVPSGGPAVEIGLIHGPIHVDFLLPATPETRAAFGFARDAGVPVDAAGVEHILVGWGARDFYTTTGTYADVQLASVWRAAAGDDAVLRADVLGAIDPVFGYPRLQLDPAEYSALLAAIAATATGGPLPEAGFTATDGFHEAHGRFHLFRTCNTWIGAMLRAAGQPFGYWTPTPYAVDVARRWHD